METKQIFILSWKITWMSSWVLGSLYLFVLAQLLDKPELEKQGVKKNAYIVAILLHDYGNVT